MPTSKSTLPFRTTRGERSSPDVGKENMVGSESMVVTQAEREVCLPRPCAWHIALFTRGPGMSVWIVSAAMTGRDNVPRFASQTTPAKQRISPGREEKRIKKIQDLTAFGPATAHDRGDGCRRPGDLFQMALQSSGGGRRRAPQPAFRSWRVWVTKVNNGKTAIRLGRFVRRLPLSSSTNSGSGRRSGEKRLLTATAEWPDVCLHRARIRGRKILAGAFHSSPQSAYFRLTLIGRFPAPARDTMDRCSAGGVTRP